ncbi:MAG: hypothetical protein BGO93_18835 [Mesorhizobium sp. 65-26]|jgi:type IV secretion system protein VirB10|uniref:type IV secretion system protein VirB10 n=1 Tax=Mesorhizobium sp. 65-26 TaxID=1895781 RepID=UPI00095AA8AF|nr:type IV secretion system protein VirB10 [Mesorhizobium sp. 65-26]OJX77643.1 MAG: hypothetical protein BGO93_18835 [Mesorhizobium sp. 65-26]
MSDPNYAQYQLDDGGIEALQRRGGRAGKATALLVAALATIAVLYYLFSDNTAVVENEPQETQEFIPPTARQPTVFAPPPAPPQPTVEIPMAPPPPPPEPQSTEAPPTPPLPADIPTQQPPAEVAVPVCEEGSPDFGVNPVCIEMERRKNRLERVRSNLVVIDQGGTGSLVGQVQGSDGTTTAVPMEGDVGAMPSLQGGAADANRAFLAQMTGAGFDSSTATKNNRTDAWIPQGTMISGTLDTAINSDLAGMTRAIVHKDVYSFDGRRILIPAGSALIGDYQTGVAEGQERVFVVWNRMIRADGVSVQLGSYGTDRLGRSGLTGEVDKKYWERFGPPALLTLVGGAAQYLAGLGDTSNQSQNIIVVNPDGSTTSIQGNGTQQDARRIAAETIAAGIQQMANEAFKTSNATRPTIHIPQGTDINVFVTRDLDFSELYPDPVREEFERIRAARRSRK